MGDIDTTSDPRVGTRLTNRYLAVERIDSGGMATVYRARDEILGRDVAIKIMHPALAADPSFVERFRREAQNAARLSHPNICAVYDFGETSSGVWSAAVKDLFIVMELVAGSTLRSLLDRFGRLDPPRALHVTRAVADALDHAHAKGIIHRDVKPENVLLTPDGQVKVVDFGIAKALGATAANLTTDHPIGTVAYVAPEQITATNVDGRADVYALGAMTYEMLTGRRPFSGDTPQAVAAARLRAPVLEPGISPQIDAAVAKATAASPDARFATPGAFARALAEGSTRTHEKDPNLANTDRLPASGADTQPEPPAQVAEHGPVEVLPFQARLYRRNRRRFRMWAAIALVLAAVAVGAYAVIPRATAVPDLRGQTLAEGRTAIENEGLAVGDINHVFHDVAAEGTIVGSDPDPGTAVKKGVKVTLLVSKGAELFSVPDIIGKPVSDATTAMEQAGFALSVGSDEYDNKIPKGAVIRYGPPRKQAKRGTSFTAVVSKGPELVAVPSLGGKSPEQAEKAIEGAGFVYATSQDYSDSVEEGTVIGSNPSGGSMSPKGSTVTAIVSRGPRPFPMPDLVGMSRSAAKSKATSLGLVIRNEYPVPGSGKPNGQVQGQNPTAGTSVRKGTPVDIYYAN